MAGSKTPIDVLTVSALLLGIQSRGMDATGMALIDKDGKLYWHKDDSSAWKFLTRQDTKDFMADHLPAAEQVILHTRAWTKGHPSKVENNHPLVYERVAVVHNGVINNDDELFRDLKLERHAETDSDVIRAILDEEGLTEGAVKELRRLRGSAAIAAIDPKMPDKLLLARCNNPLVMAVLPDNDHFIWASEKSAIHAAAKKRIKKYGMVFQAPGAIEWNPVGLDSAYIIGPEGIEWHGEFKFSITSGGYHQHMVHERYPEKQRKKQVELTEAVVERIKNSDGPGTALVLAKDAKPHAKIINCRNPECTALIELDEKQRNRPLWRTLCPECKWTAGEVPEEYAN